MPHLAGDTATAAAHDPRATASAVMDQRPEHPSWWPFAPIPAAIDQACGAEVLLVLVVKSHCSMTLAKPWHARTGCARES
jgi:hypothetical protein